VIAVALYPGLIALHWQDTSLANIIFHVRESEVPSFPAQDQLQTSEYLRP